MDMKSLKGDYIQEIEDIDKSGFFYLSSENK